MTAKNVRFPGDFWWISILLLATGFLLLPIAARAQVTASGELKSTSRTIEQLTNRLNPAVVEIDVKGWEVDDDEKEQERAGYLVHDRRLGSGVVLTPEGEILTNYHLIRGAQNITVHLLGSTKKCVAKVIGDDPDVDLALLKIDGSEMPHFDLSAGSAVSQGQIVLAIGNPYGFEHSVTLGVVSSASRELENDIPTTYIQTDAPINPGNSGGPLVDLDGHLVGINTLIYTSSGGSQGVGFAIPIETVQHSVETMETHGSVKRPHLGVFLELVTEPVAAGLNLATNSGLLVNDIDPGSPAYKSGIKPGDVILSVQGKATPDWKSLRAALNSLRVGESVEFTIERNRTQHSITVKPQYDGSRRPELMDYVNIVRDYVDQLGIIGVDLNADVRHLLPETRVPGGVVVAAKCEGIRYDTDELEADDILHQVNGHRIHNVADLRSYLLQAAPHESLVFQVEREERLMYIVIAARD